MMMNLKKCRLRARYTSNPPFQLCILGERHDINIFCSQPYDPVDFILDYILEVSSHITQHLFHFHIFMVRSIGI